MGVSLPVRLRSIEAYIVQVHGSARQLTATETLVLAQHVRGIELEVEMVSPVDTGRFRDGWDSVPFVERAGIAMLDEIGFTLTNDVPYAQYVHFANDPALFWRSTVPNIIRAFMPALLADLRQAIDNTEALLAADPTLSFFDLLQQVQTPLRIASLVP